MKKFATKQGIVEILKDVVAGNEVSYAYKRQLVALGYLDDTQKEQTDAVKQAGRGRHKIVYVPTQQGKTLLNFSKNWKKAA